MSDEIEASEPAKSQRARNVGLALAVGALAVFPFVARSAAHHCIAVFEELDATLPNITRFALNLSRFLHVLFTGLLIPLLLVSVLVVGGPRARAALAAAVAGVAGLAVVLMAIGLLLPFLTLSDGPQGQGREGRRDLLIRPGTRDDVETMASFQEVMAMETEGLRLDPETVRAGVRGVFDDPARGGYYVAEVDGQVVASLLTVPEWSDWRCGTVLWIHSVYVRPEFRRRGIFRAMYEHLKSMVLADDSLLGLRLYAYRGNEDAHRVYESLGMDSEHNRMFEWMK